MHKPLVSSSTTLLKTHTRTQGSARPVDCPSYGDCSGQGRIYPHLMSSQDSVELTNLSCGVFVCMLEKLPQNRLRHSGAKSAVSWQYRAMH